MAIKINNNTVIDDDRKGKFQMLNPRATTSYPGNQEVGDFFWKSDEKRLLTWTGTEWK